jgi:hypothetical protein
LSTILGIAQRGRVWELQRDPPVEEMLELTPGLLTTATQPVRNDARGPRISQ